MLLDFSKDGELTKSKRYPSMQIPVHQDALLSHTVFESEGQVGSYIVNTHACIS